MNTTVNYQALLHEFCDAWNRHDRDAVVSMMTEDGIFDTASGPSEHGSRHQGSEALKQAVASVWLQYPDAQWTQAQHFIIGERGFSTWTFIGTATDGQAVQIQGVDVFTFRNGKIAHKNTFRKQRIG